MDSVCDFIINYYNKNNGEYFEIEETNLDTINDMLEYVILKLVSISQTDIVIINKSIEYNDKININFSYKRKKGFISNTYNSSGYEYWVVSFDENY
jgi:hypothetical protein